MNGQPLVGLHSITKVYGMGTAAMQALREIDLHIDRGEFSPPWAPAVPASPPA